MVFRGGGKSATAEEAIVIKAAFREFRYCLVVCNTQDRAIQRLHSIRHEIETNEKLRMVFGDLVGPVWSADQLLLSNGVMIQAFGRGQSLRGAKHLDQRPDFLFGDDLEEFDDAKSEKARNETYRWFNQDLLRALDPNYLARVAATPLDVDALPNRLEIDGWKTRRIPVYHPHPTEPGVNVSSWPERFPLTNADALAIGSHRVATAGTPGTRPISIEEMEDAAQRSGTMRIFRAEMLCQAQAPEDQPFTKRMFQEGSYSIVTPRTPGWEATYAMVDPARSVKATSAMTGVAVWSWIGPKLIVWDCWQRPLMPNEILDALFEIDALYHPVILGVELDGLEEMLLQPIRQEQVRRGVTLPVQGLRAPKGKYDFIKTLQVYFNAREVSFAKPLPDLEGALLAFPTGKIDAPNALAYAIPMRGGAAIYGEFDARHIAADIEPARGRKVHLALNATRTLTTAVLVQYLDGAVRVFRDWMVEGEPSEALPSILRSARLEAGQPVYPIAPPVHFDKYQSVGLPQVGARLMQDVARGGWPDKGRPMIRDLLQRNVRSMPSLMVSDSARWTLNAFAGGYRYMPNRQGLLKETAEEGRYKVLMEGLESFAALSEQRSTADDDADMPNAMTPAGVPYVSSLPMRRR